MAGLFSDAHRHIVTEAIHLPPITIPGQAVHSQVRWESDGNSRTCGPFLKPAERMLSVCGA